MKKLFLTLFLCLFSAVLFAEDIKYSFNFYTFFMGVQGKYGDDTAWDYQRIRVRPGMVVEAEHFKGVLQLNIDSFFGKGKTIDDVGLTERKKNVGVRVAYLEIINVIPDFTFTAGIKGFSYPYIMLGEGSLIAANYNFGIGNTSLIMMSIDEGNKFSKGGYVVAGEHKDDRKAYILDTVIKGDDFKIRPAFFFVKAEKDWNSDIHVYTYRDKYTHEKAYIAAVDMKIFFVDLNGAYLKYSNQDFVTEEKLNAWSFMADAAVHINLGDFSFLPFFTWLGGQKNEDTKKVSFTNTMGDMFLLTPGGRLFLLQSGGMQDTYVGMCSELLGIDTDKHGGSLGIHGSKTAGLQVSYKIGAFNCDVLYGYVQSDKKNILGNKYIGQEVDVMLNYNITPRLSVLSEMAYIKKGQEGFLDGNAWQIIVATIFKGL